MLGEHNWTENLKTTRQYLTKGFQGFMMTEDSSGPGILLKFTMTKSKTYEQFKLQVGWPRLSDKPINQEKPWEIFCSWRRWAQNA